MRKLIVAVLLFLCSSVHSQTSRYWSEIDLATIEGALIFPEGGPSATLDLLDFELPRVTTSASVVISDDTAAISWNPVEIEPFELSNFDIDISFVGSNVTDVQTIELPAITGASFGPSNVLLPFPTIEASGAFRSEPFAVEFQPTDFAIGIEEVRLDGGALLASFVQESQFDSGAPVQELLPPNMHDTSFPDADLIVNHWFAVENFEEVFFDYSDVLFRETPVGDLTNDGTVDQSDFFVLSFNFGLVDEPTWEDGDFDANGIVDFEDFLGLAFNFDGVSQQAAAVPEPTVGCLLIGALACLGFRRRAM